MNEQTMIIRPYSLLAAICAGIGAGIIFIGLQMLLVWQVKGGSVWAPEHVIAAIAMGKGVLPPPAGPGTNVLIVGLLIHFALAIIFALILSWMVNGSRVLQAVVVGATFGFALYFIDFYLFTGVWPWFKHSRGPITICTHVIFGFVAAFIYSAWRHPKQVIVTEPRPISEGEHYYENHDHV